MGSSTAIRQASAMAARREIPDATNDSATLSLFELRRQLLRRSATLSARARGLRERGASTSAARVAVESDRLLLVARTMAENAKTRRRS